MPGHYGHGGKKKMVGKKKAAGKKAGKRMPSEVLDKFKKKAKKKRGR